MLYTLSQDSTSFAANHCCICQVAPWPPWPSFRFQVRSLAATAEAAWPPRMGGDLALSATEVRGFIGSGATDHGDQADLSWPGKRHIIGLEGLEDGLASVVTFMYHILWIVI